MNKIYILYGVYTVDQEVIKNIVSFCDSTEKAEDLKQQILDAKSTHDEELKEIEQYSEDRKKYNSARIQLFNKYKDMIKHFKYTSFEVVEKEINIIY